MSLLTAYVSLQLMLMLAWAASLTLPRLVRGWGGHVEATRTLRLEYAVLIWITLLFVGRPWLPQHSVLEPRVKVWDQTKASSGTYPTRTSSSDVVALQVGTERFVSLRSPWSWSVGLGLWTALVLLWVTWELLRLRQSVRGLACLHRIGKTRVLLATDSDIPYAAWLPGQRIIALPSWLLGKREETRISLLHELQHHRQADTLLSPLVRFLEIYCFWNPFARRWLNHLREQQEFACDEAVVFRRRISPHAYARCLSTTAQTVRRRQAHAPRGARGLGLLGRRPILLRRVKMILSQSTQPKRCPKFLVFAWSSLVLVSFGALATQTLVQDRRITEDQAKALAKKTNATSPIPVEINPAVLRQLNRLLGSAESRAEMKQALERMKEHRPQIEKTLKAYSLPMELMAVPLVESGFKNLETQPDGKPRVGVGLWMFIESTAKAYGLKVVKGEVDERTDIPKETDAAARYLKKLHDRYGSWHLALMGYNCGENAVDRKKAELKTSNPWKLIEAGVSNDPDYLAVVLAGILIMKNPELVS